VKVSKSIYSLLRTFMQIPLISRLHNNNYYKLY